MPQFGFTWVIFKWAFGTVLDETRLPVPHAMIFRSLPVSHDLVWVLSISFLCHFPPKRQNLKKFWGCLKKKSWQGLADPTYQGSCLILSLSTCQVTLWPLMSESWSSTFKVTHGVLVTLLHQNLDFGGLNPRRNVKCMTKTTLTKLKSEGLGMGEARWKCYPLMKTGGFITHTCLPL
jgi:hypothetical protein